MPRTADPITSFEPEPAAALLQSPAARLSVPEDDRTVDVAAVLGAGQIRARAGRTAGR